jgi:hypothetical protein
MPTLPTPSFPGSVPTIEGTPFAKIVATGDGTHVASRLQCLDLNTIWAELLAVQALFVGGAAREYAMNRSGGAVAAGVVVAIRSAYDPADGPSFEPASSQYYDLADARGLTLAATANGESCLVLRFGVYGPFDSSALPGAGEPVFLGETDGELSGTPPAENTPARHVVQIGKVLVQDATDGYLWVAPRVLPVLTAWQRIGGLAGSDDRFALYTSGRVRVLYGVVVSDTATSGSNGTNHWTFQIRNLTDSFNLLAVAQSTEVGELIQDRGWIISVNQAQLVTCDRTLELQIVKVLNASNLTSAEIAFGLAYIEIEA